MTVAELSVHLSGQLLFVYVLLQDCSSSHCVALEGSQEQSRAEKEASIRKKGEKQKLKHHNLDPDVHFSVLVELLL